MIEFPRGRIMRVISYVSGALLLLCSLVLILPGSSARKLSVDELASIVAGAVIPNHVCLPVLGAKCNMFCDPLDGGYVTCEKDWQLNACFYRPPYECNEQPEDCGWMLLCDDPACTDCMIYPKLCTAFTTCH